MLQVTGESLKKVTKEQKRDIRAIAAKKDDEIDFSDIPPVLDWTKAERGKFYRPREKRLSSRPSTKRF